MKQTATQWSTWFQNRLLSTLPFKFRLFAAICLGGSPRWPVRAVGGAHFAPPTHRTRRDGQDHLRSVPLSVATGGNDYALVPPVAPSSGTDRFGTFIGFIAFAQRSVRRYDT